MVVGNVTNLRSLRNLSEPEDGLTVAVIDRLISNMARRIGGWCYHYSRCVRYWCRNHWFSYNALAVMILSIKIVAVITRTNASVELWKIGSLFWWYSQAYIQMKKAIQSNANQYIHSYIRTYIRAHMDALSVCGSCLSRCTLYFEYPLIRYTGAEI